MRRNFDNLLVICVLATACLSCSLKRGPQVGGETHWLAACTQNEECGGTDLSCVCGTCTRACSGDTACSGGADAACFDVQSPLLLQRCEDLGSASSHGLCLPRCTKDVDCGGGRACMQRTCVPARQPDAGTPGATASGQPGVSISDFNGVSDNVSWTQAVAVPAPQLAIAGADERIIGTWQQVDCDPTMPSSLPPWGCMSLIVERAASGDVVGSLMVHRDYDPTAPLLMSGPFQLATDPDVGYPTEVDVKDYDNLSQNIPAEVPYRLLDGHFDNGRLTFTWAPYDLWHTWCQLQKPYLWEVGGRAFYFCVPQDAAAQASIDEGKIVLCTSADFEPLCSNDKGEQYPCSCMSGDSAGNPNPRCSPAYCHCDNQVCDADLLLRQNEGDLTLAGERLSGTWSTGPLGPTGPDLVAHIAVTLSRVSP